MANGARQALAETAIERRTASECKRDYRPKGVPRELSTTDIKVRALRDLGPSEIARRLGISKDRAKLSLDRIARVEEYERAMASGSGI